MLFRSRNIADRRIEPDVEDLAVGIVEGHWNAPIEITSDRPVLQAGLEPAPGLLNNGIAPLACLRLDELLQLSLKCRKTEIPMLRWPHNWFRPRHLGTRIDEFSLIKIRTAI